MLKAFERHRSTSSSVDMEGRPAPTNRATSASEEWSQQVQLALAVHDIEAVEFETVVVVLHGEGGDDGLVAGELAIADRCSFLQAVPPH